MTEQDRKRPPLTTAHFATFGQIITGYAACEIAMKALLSVMTASDPWVIHTITHGMTGPTLLLKIKAINARDADPGRRAEVGRLIERMEATGTLRNEIAHGSWTASQRAGYIRPSGMLVKAKGVQILGFADAEKDYSPQQLSDMADELLNIHSDIVDFLRRNGVDPSRPKKRRRPAKAKGQT